jgi:hypothetical protein
LEFKKSFSTSELEKNRIFSIREKWFTGKSTIGIWPTEFGQYCRFEKLPRLSQEYDNTKFHVVSYCPESPTPLHPHLHPHAAPRQFFKFGNIVEIPLPKFLLSIFRLTGKMKYTS